MALLVSPGAFQYVLDTACGGAGPYERPGELRIDSRRAEGLAPAHLSS